MPQLLNHVQPGQIITSDMWNLAVDAINGLLQSGQTSGIAIKGAIPAGSQAEPLRVSTVVQLTGQSFGYSLGATTVSFEAQFGTFVVTQDQLLLGSSDTRLLVRVPPMPGLPQTGATMTLRVSNGVASDQRSVVVMPLVIALQGNVFVNWRGDVTPNPSPNPIVINSQADFAYQLQAATNIPTAFDLTADIPQASVALPADFAKSILMFDPRSPNQALSQLSLGRDEARNLVVRIPGIPAALQGQTFTLRLRATSGQIIGADQRAFTVGTLITPPDSSIQVLQVGSAVFLPSTGAQDTTGTNGSLDGTTIRLRAPWQMQVNFNVTFTQGGTYDVTVQPDTGTTGWNAALVDTAAQLANIPANTSVPMTFSVTAAPTSSPSGSVLFRVKRTDSASDQTRQYTLQLLPAG